MYKFLVALMFYCSILYSANWEIADSLGTQISSASLMDSNTIVVSYKDQSSVHDFTKWRGYVSISKDYGKTWENIWEDSLDIPIKTNITEPEFLLTIENGGIMGVISSSILLKTTNYGKTWDSLEFNENRNIMNMKKNSDNICLYFYQNEFCYISYNNGDSFTKLVFPKIENFEISDFSIPDSSLIFVNYIENANANNNKILRSTDGGATYDSISSQTEHTLFIHFINDSIGFISGRYDEYTDWRYVLFRTNDGGVTWNEVYRETDMNHFGYPLFKFANEPNGLMYYMNNYSIYVSKDYGKTWRYLELDEYPVEHNIANGSMDLYDSKHGVYTMPTHNYVFVLKDKETSIINYTEQTNFLIYPNPASDYIEIYLGSHRDSKGACPLVSSDGIAIYDVLGNVVEQTSSSVHSGGTPELLRFDISHLPRGVYFVRVGERVVKFVKR